MLSFNRRTFQTRAFGRNFQLQNHSCDFSSRQRFASRQLLKCVLNNDLIDRGFKNERTVELLKQRARRLENSATTKKKLSQLGKQMGLRSCWFSLKLIECDK